MSKPSKVLVIGSGSLEKRGFFKTMPHKLIGGRIIVNRKISYSSPSPGGRELEGGEIHPHLLRLRCKFSLYSPFGQISHQGRGTL